VQNLRKLVQILGYGLDEECRVIRIQTCSQANWSPPIGFNNPLSVALLSAC
jgi:hypothetical protein